MRIFTALVGDRNARSALCARDGGPFGPGVERLDCGAGKRRAENLGEPSKAQLMITALVAETLVPVDVGRSR